MRSRIGARRLGRRLGAPELGRRDHLHGLGDLLRRLDGGDAVSQVLQRGHCFNSRPFPRRRRVNAMHLQANDLA